jgi:phosphoribosylaminoimidazolecarboxamide formyltransferase/IMP cyclohydrolase
MNQHQTSPLALISVTDKTGIVDFARGLMAHGYKILSTGGSAKLLSDNGVAVTEVADFTQSPEILSGRVKTLHPKVHGGILFDRSNPQHQTEMQSLGFSSIDMVVVNLYQFEKNAKAQNLSLEKAIEFIDIGGPTMLRAAAKNYRFCLPVIDPTDYPRILSELKGSSITLQTRTALAAKVFATISDYDAMIAGYFKSKLTAENRQEPDALPARVSLALEEALSLRYGENPHQKAGFYKFGAGGFDRGGLTHAEVLQGKELSYNNLLDIDGAAALVRDFPHASCIAIIKHTNPCGIAIGYDEPLLSVYEKALAGDPKSAFGGIIATNEVIDAATAKTMSQTFYECIAAPGFTPEAREIFGSKKNLRLLVLPMLDRSSAQNDGERYVMRSICGGVLVQSYDSALPQAEECKSVTKRMPDDADLKDMLFAMTVAKHVKSNAIVFAKNLRTLTIGAGQMSRIDAATFAATKACEEGKDLKGAVMASDAFFPFRDNVDLAAKHGIKAIIQPGGSMRDQESIDACDEHNIAMVFTGKRHFKH